MKKSFCDACDKLINENYDYSVDIVAFKKKMELNVSVAYMRGIGGYPRWGEVELCQQCKMEALKMAVATWEKQKYKETHAQCHW